MFRNDAEYAVKAKRVSDLALDISEVIAQVLADGARATTEALNRRAAERRNATGGVSLGVFASAWAEAAWAGT